MYIIQKIWISPLENEISAASGYTILGCVSSKEKADKLVEIGGKMKASAWPPIKEGTDRISYTEMQEIDTLEWYEHQWKYVGTSQELRAVYTDGTYSE